MPSDIDFLPVMEKLLARTRERKELGKERGYSNTFVSVMRWFPRFRQNTTANRIESRRLTMSDAASEMVFNVWAAEPSQDTTQDDDKIFRVLEELWESARRVALDIDRKIREVERMLDGI